MAGTHPITYKNAGSPKRFRGFTIARAGRGSGVRAEVGRCRSAGSDAATVRRFAITPDSLPYIGPHRRYPRHAYALGYGGNGMTFAWMAAQILLEQWKGIASSDHQLFSFNRLR